jgi:hypothetical protein
MTRSNRACMLPRPGARLAVAAHETMHPREEAIFIDQHSLFHHN